MLRSIPVIVFAGVGMASASVCATNRGAEQPAWALSVAPGENGTYRIHVADTFGRIVQVIEGQEGDPPFEADQLLTLKDFSGDGQPDILARGLSVGVSGLTSESIYVYDPAAGRFLARESFEHEGEVTALGSGCIGVDYRNADNITYSRDVYCWRGSWIFQRRED